MHSNKKSLHLSTTCQPSKKVSSRRKFWILLFLLQCKVFDTKKASQAQKMSHVFTKTFACHFCEEIFISNPKHERVHTGIIKFECKVCNFRANRFTTMEDHKNNEQGYICPICQERACEYSDIKHHVFESHGEYLAVDEPIGFVDSASSWMFFKGE
ncbi:hypothetical protein CRE_07343 [Caenorhabditis remanei]|uniref:C2H2-type domain-containing protein n=1 Tax=Caenorhabditis remanei TaxID=31234 RepID=E3M2B2_CAERE|nr:hypothetical protein CRE_07343 [Caenorhabditis remanei]